MFAAHRSTTWCVALSSALLIAAGCGDDGGGGPGDTGDDTGGATSATVATFNLGLVDGYVPLARERLPANVTAIAASDFDVMCLQEVWLVSDVEAIINAEGSPYTSSYWVDSTEAASPPACTNEDVADLLGCARDNDCDNDPEGLSACAVDNCGTEINALSASNSACFQCLVSQLGAEDLTIDSMQQACVEEGGYTFSSQGRNGLILLSKSEMTATEALELDSYLTRRYVLHAQIDLPAVGPTDVFCTHLTSGQEVPYMGNSDSWADENADQIATLLAWIDDRAGTNRVVLLGDFNTAPAVGELTPEDPENYALIPAAGYVSAYVDGATDPPCTFCESNTLRTGADVRDGKIIDHIFLRGFDDATVTTDRIFVETAEITTDDGAMQSNLSDHFGVSASITP